MRLVVVLSSDSWKGIEQVFPKNVRLMHDITAAVALNTAKASIHTGKWGTDHNHIWSPQWLCTVELKETLSLMCTTHSQPSIHIRTFSQRRFCGDCSISSVTVGEIKDKPFLRAQHCLDDLLPAIKSKPPSSHFLHLFVKMKDFWWPSTIPPYTRIPMQYISLIIIKKADVSYSFISIPASSHAFSCLQLTDKFQAQNLWWI